MNYFDIVFKHLPKTQSTKNKWREQSTLEKKVATHRNLQK